MFTAIICEYNPMHSGHIYHLQKAKELGLPIILVMSGNFCQRGEISVLSKFEKARLAVQNGADVVVELPTVFATSPAPDFAFYAIKLLNEIGNVKYLSFGSECGDIKMLESLASLEFLDLDLSNGNSFQRAVNQKLSTHSNNDFVKSNNILGIEYLRAIRNLGSMILPCTIKREGDYNQTALDGKYASSTAIRQSDLAQSKKYLPENVYDSLQKSNKPNMQTYYDLLRAKLLTCDNSKVNLVSEGIENYLAKKTTAKTFSEFISSSVTKRYGKNRIMRTLYHILLGVTKEQVEVFKTQPAYARVLAVSKQNANLLASIPNKLTNVQEKNQLLEFDILSTVLWNIVTCSEELEKTDFL